MSAVVSSSAVAREKRKPTPYFALGTVNEPAKPVPIPGIRSVELNVERLDVPDHGPATIRVECPRGDWMVLVRVEPATRRIVIPIAGNTDLLGAFNHGRLAFDHPGCSAHPETTAAELRRIVGEAYVAGRDRARLP